MKDPMKLLFKLASIFLVFLLEDCSRHKNDQPFDVFGVWNCIRLDTVMISKPTPGLEEESKEPRLHIDFTKLYFENLDIIKPCTYDWLKVHKYDTTSTKGIILEKIYNKKDLVKTLCIEPVDNDNKPTCKSGCASLFLKQDTLISLFGGHVYYFVKE
ncbi:MAG: hypothetical protein U0X39_11810 [Bacteroidales bacterium]